MVRGYASCGGINGDSRPQRGGVNWMGSSKVSGKIIMSNPCANGCLLLTFSPCKCPPHPGDSRHHDRNACLDAPPYKLYMTGKFCSSAHHMPRYTAKRRHRNT